jgi:tetratricopeptide (TPR) repeat protein
MQLHRVFLFFLIVVFITSSFIMAQETELSQPGQQQVPAQAEPVFTQPQTPAQTTQPAQQTPQTQAPAVQQAPPAQQRPLNQNTQRQTGSDALQSYRVGRDLETRNRFDEANTYYNEAVRICMDELNRNSANMDSYTVLTWTLLRQRRYAEVINWGDRALRINPGDFRIVETMGEAYFYLNDYEHSLIMMQRYAASMPRGDRASTVYFFMGEIYRNQRKYLHADIAYTTAVTLESGVFLWWFRLGNVRESAGEYESAVAAYERSVSLNPTSREATEALERTKRLNATAQR